MEELVYNALNGYFSHLENTGYYKQSEVNRLLLLVFIHEFLYNDLKGYITGNDCSIIKRALNCLYGSNCMIPYPDYYTKGKTVQIMNVSTIKDEIRENEAEENS